MAGDLGLGNHFQDSFFIHTLSTLVGIFKGWVSLELLAQVPAHVLIGMETKR